MKQHLKEREGRKNKNKNKKREKEGRKRKKEREKKKKESVSAHYIHTNKPFEKRERKEEGDLGAFRRPPFGH